MMTIIIIIIIMTIIVMHDHHHEHYDDDIMALSLTYSETVILRRHSLSIMLPKLNSPWDNSSGC